jgi:hypothetical protein
VNSPPPAVQRMPHAKPRRVGNEGATQGNTTRRYKFTQFVVCQNTFHLVKLLFNFLPSFLRSGQFEVCVFSLPAIIRLATAPTTRSQASADRQKGAAGTTHGDRNGTANGVAHASVPLLAKRLVLVPRWIARLASSRLAFAMLGLWACWGGVVWSAMHGAVYAALLWHRALFVLFAL